MGDIKNIHNTPNKYHLKITGKGDVEREILLFDDTMESIIKYRQAIGLGDGPPSKNDKTPLIPQLTSFKSKKSISSKPLSSGRIHEILKDVFHDAASAIEQNLHRFDDPVLIRALKSDIDVLNNASAHWLRAFSCYLVS